MDLFKRPVFALSSLTAICAFSAQGLAFVSLPFLLQAVLGHSQVETGFLMTPWPAVVAVMALVAGRLADRVSLGALCGIGLLMLSLGMAPLAMAGCGLEVDVVVVGVFFRGRWRRLQSSRCRQ